MKWGRKSTAEEQKKPKRSNSKNPSPSSSSPASLLSAVFPFSWISRLKRSNKSHQRPNSPPANPKRSAPCGTDRLSSSPRVVDPITGGDAPRRRSTGDDDGRRQMAFARDQNETSKSTRHYSLGDLELRPFSGRRQWDPELPAPRSPKQQRRITVRMRSPPPLPPLKRVETGRRGQRMRQRVKVCSPRAGRRRGEGEEKGEKRSLERFAVVRRSSDPQKDFRESMVEMIREKGMGRPEEMERLLACYITLNADEHHDVIVKAFRQVWFDVGPGRVAGGECRCCDCCSERA